MLNASEWEFIEWSLPFDIENTYQHLNSGEMEPRIQCEMEQES